MPVCLETVMKKSKLRAMCFFFFFFFYNEECQKKKVQVGFQMNELISNIPLLLSHNKFHINYKRAIYGSWKNCSTTWWCEELEAILYIFYLVIYIPKRTLHKHQIKKQLNVSPKLEIPSFSHLSHFTLADILKKRKKKAQITLAALF